MIPAHGGCEMRNHVLVREYSHVIAHHGRKGQKWGVMNGPPYPLDRKAIASSQYYVGGRRANSRKTDASGEYKESGTDTTFRLKTRRTSREEDLGAANPLRFSKNYSWMNCTCCATAYDLRRRGYDVIAGDPFPDGVSDDSELTKFYKGIKPSDSFFHKYQKSTPRETSSMNSYAIAKWMRKEILDQGYGARGMILLDTVNFSHAFNYENNKGVVKFLDAQTNSEYTLNGVANIALNAAIIRLDDKEPNYQYLKQEGVVHDA